MQVQHIRFALRKKARESRLPDLGRVTVLRVHSVPGRTFLLSEDVKISVYSWYYISVMSSTSGI